MTDLLSSEALALLWDIHSTLAQGDDPIYEVWPPDEDFQELVDAGLVVWHGKGMCFPTCRMLLFAEALPERFTRPNGKLHSPRKT